MCSSVITTQLWLCTTRIQPISSNHQRTHVMKELIPGEDNLARELVCDFKLHNRSGQNHNLQTADHA